MTDKPTMHELVDRLLATTGYQVTVPLSSELSASACAITFELLKVLLGVGFDVEVQHAPSPQLIIGRRR